MNQLTLGQFIKTLRLLDPDMTIKGIGNGAGSYRGYYDQLSFPTGECKVNDLLATAIACVGGTFVGYKGGEYTMDNHTYVWCANYSNTGKAICGVTIAGDRAYIYLEDDD